MPKHGACNLASINLSEYILNPFTQQVTFDYDSLTSDMYAIVRAMDDVLEENLDNHALPEQREMAAKYRNVGIGVMGIHDMFIKFGFRYGDRQSVVLLEDIMGIILGSAINASVKLAKERGNCPGYNSKIWDSKIIKEVFTSQSIKGLKEGDALRNCSLISVAPCGSIGTMLNVSTGIEPWFSTHYTRHTKSLNGEQETSYEVWAPVVKEAMDRKWFTDYIVTANDINSEARINIQAAVQRYCDTAISSTLNLPKTTTPSDIRKIYIKAWEAGLKGVTVYVDGSRDPILSTENTPVVEEKESKTTFNTIEPVSRKTIGTTYGATHCKKCACGTLYITTNLDKDGNLVEVFTHTSKGGICQANLNAVTRMISMSLRAGVKIDEIEDQLKSIHCPACQMAKAKGHEIDGMSCPDIMSRTIKEFKDNHWAVCKKNRAEENKTVKNGDNKCPECGETIVNSGGCVSCPSCGWSRCS